MVLLCAWLRLTNTDNNRSTNNNTLLQTNRTEMIMYRIHVVVFIRTYTHDDDDDDCWFFSLDGSLVHPLVFGISLLCVHGMRSVNCSLFLSRTWSFFFFSVTLFVVVVAIVVAVCCFRTLQVQAKTMVRRVYERVCACVCVRTLRKTNERVYVVSIQPVDIYASVRLRVILLLCFVLVLICCERFFLLSICHLCCVVFSTTIVVVSVAVLFSIKSASLQKRNKKPIYTRSK